MGSFLDKKYDFTKHLPNMPETQINERHAGLVAMRPFFLKSEIVRMVS